MKTWENSRAVLTERAGRALLFIALPLLPWPTSAAADEADEADGSHLSAALLVGSGFAQVVESAEERDIHFGAPVVLGVDLHAAWPRRSVGFRLRTLSSTVRVKGVTRVSGTAVDGWLDHLVVYPMLDWHRQFDPWFLSLVGGPGFGGENFIVGPEAGGRSQFLLNVAMRIGAGLQLGPEVQLWVEDQIIVSDFPRAVAYLAGGWKDQSGGEDASNFVLLGVAVAW